MRKKGKEENQLNTGEGEEKKRPSEKEEKKEGNKKLKAEDIYLEKGKWVAGRYEIKDELGHGTFGKVYLARDHKTHSDIALKVSYNLMEYVISAENEVNTLKDICHKNVIKLYGADQDYQYYYVAYECCDKTDVFNIFNKKGSENEDEARSILKQVIAGYSALYKSKITNRDIKPSNLLTVREKNGTLTVKICDFGIAVHQDDSSVFIQGTYRFMAPEVSIRGHKYKSYKIDVWSIACTMYFIIHGRNIIPPSDERITKEFLKEIIATGYELDLNKFRKSRRPYWVDFFNACLQDDEAKREGWEYIVKHPLITEKIQAHEILIMDPPEKFKMSFHNRKRNEFINYDPKTEKIKNPAGGVVPVPIGIPDPEYEEEDEVLKVEEEEMRLDGKKTAIFKAGLREYKNNVDNIKIDAEKGVAYDIQKLWEIWKRQQRLAYPYRPYDGIEIELKNETMTDGSIYYGFVELTGKPHGRGKIIWDDGQIYEGYFKLGNISGYGRRIYSSNCFYEGEFKDGITHGKGTLWKTNNNDNPDQEEEKKSVIEVVEEKLMITFDKMYSYKGDWREGIKHGHGVEKKPGEYVYIGEFNHNKKELHGKYCYIDGSEYEGQLFNGERSGEGTFRFNDGKVYVGKYVCDKMDGCGVLKFPNTAEYIGNFKDDRYHGDGILKDEKGDTYKGIWKNGKKDGIFLMISKAGNIEIQVWKNDGLKSRTPVAVDKTGT